MSDLMSRMALDDELKRLVEVVSPAESALWQQGAEQVITRSGGIDRSALLALLPPVRFDWGPGDVRRIAAETSCQTAMIRAHATTPPTGARCIVTVSMETEVQGQEVLGTVEIPQGQRIGSRQLAVEIPNGAWLSASVTTAGGASGVSTTMTARMI